MGISPVVADLMRRRPDGDVWLHLAQPTPTISYDDLATLAGIEPLGRAWVEIDRNRAHQLLALLIGRDLAYESELIQPDTAYWAAGEFVAAFGDHDLKIATNTADLPGGGSFGWTPATSHTFDCGVAIIGARGAGIFWVGDED